MMFPSKMSGQGSVSSRSEKEPWQVEFENEAVNDDRWNCIVTSLIETKVRKLMRMKQSENCLECEQLLTQTVEDEECLRIFTQSIARGQIPLVRTIAMSDLVARFKNESKSEETKKNTNRKMEKKFKEKAREQPKDTFSVSHSYPRFPEVTALISKYAKSSEGVHSMPPNIMAYALKYMILEMKNEDYNYRRVSATLRRKTRESKLKEEIIRKLNGSSEERVVPKFDKVGNDNTWGREKFDVLQGSPSQEGPLNGPEMYIVLSNFYNSLYFAELIKINVPFVAVIKIDNFKTISEKASNSAGFKRQEGINYFWSEFEDGVTGRPTTNLYKDVALVKYTPVLCSEHSVEEKYATIVNDLIATLYGVYHLNRLHQNYIQQMKIHRMIEMLEPLDLSRCETYNKLCDALVTEDSNCEMFVLFSIVEQVACGVPEIKTRNLDHIRESSEISTDSNELKALPFSVENEEEDLVALNYLSESVRERKRKQLGMWWKNPVIYFYDDLISLRAADVDQNILKTETIFQRFVMNSILSKISNKYPKLSPAQKTTNDFQFFRLWEKSKETEENFKVKLFFSVVMRLIERTQVFEGGCEDLISSTASFLSSSNESGKSKSRSNATLPPDESAPRETVFQEVADMFYAKVKSPQNTVEKKKSSTKATLELRKVTAFPELAPTESTSLENLELACGRCQKFEVQNDEEEKDERDNPTYLGQLLESYEISYLNEPNLLVDRKEFETFVAKHNFYEVLEPNRSVQRLQQLYDNYNTTEYTYFSPTDTLFVLGHNDADFRGLYHSQEKGVITSPLSLRDFFTFILPENRKWMENEDAEYIRFLEGVKERLVEEEQRKDHEFKCRFLKKYRAMTESERNKLLEEIQMEKGQDIQRRSLSDKRLAELTLDGMQDLPVKAKQSPPKKFRFNGFNFGEIRTQVNVVGNEFHSDDGSMVGIKILSWLYGPSLITLTVHRMGSKLYLHKWTEGDIRKESLHFKDSSGVLVTFDVDRSFPHFSKITWPNGLIIERLPVKGLTSFYVKQSYLENYRIEETIATESSRCFLSNGQILVFRVNKTIEILSSNGTKHQCQVREKKEKLPHCSPKTNDDIENEELEVIVKETVTPSGEVWVADESSKCMTLVKTMIVLTGVDAEKKETFYRREDGTNCMLWPDGKLVTNYPDGTKITSKPEFEEEEVFIDGNMEEKKYSAIVNTEPGINSADDVPGFGESNGFVVVTCSYLMENPMYSAVFFKGSKLEMRMPQKMKIVVTQGGTYKIESHHSVLRASSESVEFYNVCNRCNKKSVSTIYLNSLDLDVMCKTKDYYDKKFTVYGSGKILHTSKSEDFVSPEYEEEELQASITAGKQRTECCEHHKLCKPSQRCLILERDLTGIEFISEKSLYRYIGSLSDETYYDLCRTSADNIQLQHAFFEPVYATGRKRYVMKYEENDSYPTRLTRKHLVGTRSPATHCAHVTTNAQYVNLKKKEKPKVIIARFVKVIHPDPVTVMEIIANAIALYQKRSNEVTEIYRKHLKERKQFPFANYVAKELNLIASTLCKSLDLYPHTCTTTPHTEMDLHSAGHKFCLNSYFQDVNPDDLQSKILPRCKQILKPFRHKGIHEDIHEHESDQNP